MNSLYVGLQMNPRVHDLGEEDEAKTNEINNIRKLPFHYFYLRTK